METSGKGPRKGKRRMKEGDKKEREELKEGKMRASGYCGDEFREENMRENENAQIFF
jgi:hypothetical protein